MIKSGKLVEALELVCERYPDEVSEATYAAWDSEVEEWSPVCGIGSAIYIVDEGELETVAKSHDMVDRLKNIEWEDVDHKHLLAVFQALQDKKMPWARALQSAHTFVRVI